MNINKKYVLILCILLAGAPLIFLFIGFLFGAIDGTIILAITGLIVYGLAGGLAKAFEAGFTSKNLACEDKQQKNRNRKEMSEDSAIGLIGAMVIAVVFLIIFVAAIGP